MRTLPNDEEDNQYGYHYVADALYQVTGKYADLKDIADYYKLAKLDPIGAIAIVQPDGFILNNVIKVSENDRNHIRCVWKSARFDVVVKGNLAKFSQNERLKSYLLSTADRIIVEASPKDDVWGIGLEESAIDVINPRKWKGTNLLGFALMEVRDLLKE